MFGKSDTIGFNGEMLKLILGPGSFDVNGFDCTGTCASPSFLSSNFGPDDVGRSLMFCISDTFGLNGEMLIVCTPEDGLNFAGSFSLNVRLGLGSVDINGFDSTGTCTSSLLLKSNSGPVCDVSGEGWSVAEYLDFTFLVPGTKKKPQTSIRT